MFSLVFSVLFCMLCCVVDSLLGFWVFLELGSLSIVPSILLMGDFRFSNMYSSMMSYIVMSGLSSVLFVSGLLINGLYYFIFLGFSIKFGLFPFMFWVYRVFSIGKWFFIFFLRVIMKFPVLFFCYLYQVNYTFIDIDCFFTIVVCSCLVWFFRLGWEYVWCHISLSSVATLVVACFYRSVEVCFFIYWYYFFWGVLCIVYFFFVSDYMDVKGYYFWGFVLLLLVTPVSIPLFYKLAVCVGIVYSSLYVLLSWVIYRFSEQFFLYKLASDYFYSGVFKDWVN